MSSFLQPPTGFRHSASCDFPSRNYPDLASPTRSPATSSMNSPMTASSIGSSQGSTPDLDPQRLAAFKEKFDELSLGESYKGESPQKVFHAVSFSTAAPSAVASVPVVQETAASILALEKHQSFTHFHHEKPSHQLIIDCRVPSHYVISRVGGALIISDPTVKET